MPMCRMLLLLRLRCVALLALFVSFFFSACFFLAGKWAQGRQGKGVEKGSFFRGERNNNGGRGGSISGEGKGRDGG